MRSTVSWVNNEQYVTAEWALDVINTYGLTYITLSAAFGGRVKSSAHSKFLAVIHPKEY